MPQIGLRGAQLQLECPLRALVLDEALAAIHPAALVGHRNDAIHEMRQVAMVAVKPGEVNLERAARRDAGAKLGAHAFTIGGMHQLVPQLGTLAEVGRCGGRTDAPPTG
jgi:hypothetical protein